MLESQNSSTNPSPHNPMEDKGIPEEISSKAIVKHCQDEIKCSICWKYLYHCMTVSPCMHNFCSFCLSEYLSGNYWRAACPLCKGEIQLCNKNLLLNNSIDYTNDSNPEFQISQREKSLRDETDLLLKGAKFKKYDNRCLNFGYFKDNQKEGKGKFMDFWRNEYEGEWRNDKAEGQGECNYSNGERYSGEWKNGKRDGFGEITFGNGGKYKGEWKDDFKHGFGEETFGHGRKYVGYWKKGKIEGQGEHYYANGDHYKGGFENYQKQGFGEYTFADGRKEAGEWKNNVFYGPRQVNNEKEESDKKKRKEALWDTDIRFL